MSSLGDVLNNVHDSNTSALRVSIAASSSGSDSQTLFQNLGANATLNIKATSGNVYALYCHNVGGSPAYIQLHNTATTPSGGATPALTFLVPAGGTIFVENTFLGDNGYNFATGIAFAFSTTEATYTAATAANQVTQVMYK